MPHAFAYFREHTVCSEGPGWSVNIFIAPQRNHRSLDLINSAWGWPGSWPFDVCVCVCVFSGILPVVNGEKHTYGIQASSSIRATVCAAGLSWGVKGLVVCCDCVWLFFKCSDKITQKDNNLLVKTVQSTNSVIKTTWNILSWLKRERSTESGNTSGNLCSLFFSQLVIGCCYKLRASVGGKMWH